MPTTDGLFRLLNTTNQAVPCKETRSAIDYNGTLSYTYTGQICQTWTIYKNASLPLGTYDKNNSTEIDNYCRNVNNNSKGPWCWTDYANNQWDYCGLPICGVSLELNDLYVTNPWNSFIASHLWFISNNIRLVFYPSCLVIGTLLNCLSIAVFTRPALKKSTTALLLVSLAVVDTICLNMGTAIPWLRALTGWHLDASNNLSCRIYGYIGTSAIGLSSWVLVLVTIERVIAIVKASDAKTICSKRNASITLVCLIGVLGSMNSPLLKSFQATYKVIFYEDEINFFAMPDCSYCCVANNIFYRIFASLINILFPFAMVMVGNIVVTVFLTNQHHTRQSMRSSTKVRESISHSYEY